MTELHLLNDNPPDRHRPHPHQQTGKQLSSYRKLKPPTDLFSPLSGDAGEIPAMTSPPDYGCDVAPEECASIAAHVEGNALRTSFDEQPFEAFVSEAPDHWNL
jgi:hypothetical protein